VVSSLVERFSDDLAAHARGEAPATEPVLITELVDLDDGRPVLDDRFLQKQPDWTYDEEWSGKAPADRFADHRAPEEMEA